MHTSRTTVNYGKLFQKVASNECVERHRRWNCNGVGLNDSSDQEGGERVSQEIVGSGGQGDRGWANVSEAADVARLYRANALSAPERQQLPLEGTIFIISDTFHYGAL
jgi:hypothetical protein